MPDFTTTALLASIRRRAAVPNSAGSGTQDADLLAIASEEQRSYVALKLREKREDFFAFEHSFTTEEGTASYLVPDRAQGGGLQEVELVDSSGDVTNLARIPRREKWRESTDNAKPEGFYFSGGFLVLSPTPDAAYTVRIPYFFRPSQLVATSAVAVISAINTGTDSVTLSATIPATFTTSQRFDFVRAKPGFEPLAIDATATVASGTGMTFSADLPDNLAVGDYVCLAGESPVPYAPVEWHDLLSIRAALAVRTGPLRDESIAAILHDAQEEVEAALGIVTPRAEGEAETTAQTRSFFAGGS